MPAHGPAQPSQADTGPTLALGVARSFDDVRRIVAEHCERIGMTRGELDAEAGLADGHAGKLLARRARKRLGPVSLGRVIAAAGLVLIVALDPDAPPRASTAATKPRPLHWRHRRDSAWGKRMAALRALKLSAPRRIEIGRMGAQARWQRKKPKPAVASSGTATTRQLSMF